MDLATVRWLANPIVSRASVGGFRCLTQLTVLASCVTPRATIHQSSSAIVRQWSSPKVHQEFASTVRQEFAPTIHQ